MNVKSEPSVLIVDDQENIRKVTRAMLGNQGYVLYEAGDGQSVLEMVRQFTPDVILLDVLMPGMDGLEVCRVLKADRATRHVPVILVTALDGKEDIAEGLDAGADDFLNKPVSRVELQARVRSHMRIKQQFDALQSALQLREDLTRMLVHDMRSPLTSILIFSQLISKAEGISERVARHAQRIHSQAQRLDSFTNDLILAAKMEQGQMLLSRTEFDLGEHLRNVLKDSEALAQSKNIQLEISIPEQPVMVKYDQRLLERVICNLLANAVKYSPAGVPVSVTTVPPHPEDLEEGWKIRVSDLGPGVPEQDRERIFDKFEIVKMKKEGISQVGLGLPFCRMVAEAHGGKVNLNPNQPTGCIFSVDLGPDSRVG